MLALSTCVIEWVRLFWSDARGAVAPESGHESPALALERYTSARAELDASADAGVAVLRARLTERRRAR